GWTVGYFPAPRPVQVPSRGARASTSGCSSGGTIASTRRAYVAVRAQRLDLAFEIGCRRERPVHRREPQVRHLVKFTQRAQNREADLMAGHLRRARSTHGVFHLLRQEVQRVVVDLAALARPADAANDLFAAEGLGDSAALDHSQNCGLDGAE